MDDLDLNYNGQIHLIIGPMFSGKTSELFRRIRRFSVAQYRCAIFKYDKDIRYNEDEFDNSALLTHDKTIIPAISISKLQDINCHLTLYDVIGIDEGQFYKDIVDYSEQLANLGKIIIISGLDGTFQRKPFHNFLELIPLAETVCKLSAVCSVCYKDAPFTLRTSQSLKLEIIGGSDVYSALCRKCYFETQKTKILT